MRRGHSRNLILAARIEPRVVDLLEPFRSFSYYNPAQCGSASMKAVLPALTGRGYDQLAIQEGGMASQEYFRVTFGDVTEQERQRVRQQLEEYCGQDTMGMIWIVDELRQLLSRERKSSLTRLQRAPAILEGNQ